MRASVTIPTEHMEALSRHLEARVPLLVGADGSLEPRHSHVGRVLGQWVAGELYAALQTSAPKPEAN